MAEKSFGIKEINLIGASGTPTIESPNNLNLNAINVAISTNVSIGGTLTVTGNVSIGGTFTYEDVTNIDSVGIITARSDIKVGTGVTLTPAGAGFFSGIVTASNFVKRDGSSLGGVSPDAQGNLVAGTSAGANFSGTDANHNILMGYEAGNALTTADNNVAIGYEALKFADTEGNNVAIGYRALKEMTGMGSNVAIGYEAGYYTYSLYNCVAVGFQAMSKPTQGSFNTWYSVAVGSGAMGACGGDKCVAIGYEALDGSNAYNSDEHTAVGYQSLSSVTFHAQQNTALGALSGKATTSGDKNIYIGYNAGNNVHATGDNCIIIGSDAAATSSSVSNEITLGDANITKLRIPGIDVVLKDNGGTPTEGHVLTVDGSGEASFVGITSSSPVTNFVVTANGSSAYRFAGGGVDASEDNPDLFLEKGVKYRFDNTTGSSHPFAFRVSNGGSAYTNGITGSQNGVQFFTVPYDAPDVLAYQCTIHGGMVGNIWTYAKTTQCYDIYRLAANYTIPASDTTITQSMVRPTLFFEKIGPGMSVSSGVFTFPSTGKYEIQAFFQGFQSNGNDNIFKFNMDATADNSNWQEVVNCRAGNYDSGRAFSATFTYLIDITNTSTHKVRFGTTTAGSNRVQLDGNSASNILDGTYFVFKKILNT